MIEEPIKKVTREEMVIIIIAIKPGKAAGPSKVCTEIASARGEVGISVMIELCLHVLDGKGMLDEWQTSVLVSIFKEIGDVRSFNVYRGVKSLKYAIKIVQRVLKRNIRKLVNGDKMQFSITPGRGTADALFVVKRMQEEYRGK